MTRSRRWLPLLALAALPAPAPAQLGRTNPGPGYFAALDELHAGYLRRAERGMRNELRTAVRFGPDTRWIDSVLYATGLGEALYQQGRLREALAQFDAAIDQFLVEPDWMLQLRFRQPPREDQSLARRLPAWARPARPRAYADVPRSVLYSYGRLNNSGVVQQGGVVQQAQLWKLDAEELSRSIAWALYRRGQLLGPLGAYDKRTSAVVGRLAAGGLGPPDHWSGVWVELWWGLAAASSGDVIGAQPHLQNALRMAGRYDHRLAGIAWLALGQLALGDGDPIAAGDALSNAAFGAIAYDDIDVLVEAINTRGAITVGLGVPTPQFPSLDGIVTLAERRGFWLASAAGRLALAETGSGAGVQQAFRRGRDLSSGLLGRKADRLLAMSSAASSPRPRAEQAARQAVEAQAAMSRRRLQVTLAGEWLDDGRLSPRLARQVYAEVLGDPTLLGWIATPLDAVASMAAPESGAYRRWFATAVDRKDALLALTIIDSERRREWFAGQPLGGRKTAIRWLLEAPDERLPPFAIEARARLIALAPEYRELRRSGGVASDALRAALDASPADATPAMKNAAADLAESVRDRERVVGRLAMSRAVTPLVFPPPLDPVLAQQSLTAGEAVLAFHEAAGDLFGIVLTAQGEHLWKVGPAKRVAAQIERLLREVAGASGRQNWSIEDLDSTAWDESASELSESLFADSRLDGGTLTRLWIVPDGPLWRAPLSILPIPGDAERVYRLGDATVSYAPTPGWAVRPRVEGPPSSAPARGWMVAAEANNPKSWEGDDPLDADFTAPPRGLQAASTTLKRAADRLLLDTVGRPLAADPLGLELTVANDGLRDVAAWSRLPWGGPRQLALVGLGGGHGGGSANRRSGTAPAVGAPELHTLASLLAGGAECVLVERWPTDGVRSHDLLAEWFVGLGRLPAADAWTRSLNLGRDAPLDAIREPRLNAEPGESIPASHPFWWSGFLLVE